MTDTTVQSEDPRIGLARDRALSWLAALGWTVQQKSVPGTSWLLRAEDGLGHHISVSQSAANPEVVAVGGAVQPSAEHATGLEALAATELNDFLWNMRFELLRMRVEFVIEGPGLKRIAVKKTLLWDNEMTRNRFLDSAQDVQRAIIAVVWLIRRRLEEPNPPEAGFGPN
jgi:hypothetical protein